MDDPDLGVRTNAALSLVGHAPTIETHPAWCEKLVPPALRGLNEVGKLPIAASDLLGYCGQAGRVAIPGLKAQMVEHPGPQRKLASARALLRLDPETSADVTPVVRALLKDKAADTRAETLKTIAYLGDKARDVAPDLISMVSECPDLAQRALAVQVLLKVKREDAAKAVPALVALIKEIDRQTEGKLKPTKDASGRTIRSPEAMAHPLYQVRADTIDLLRSIDAKAAEDAAK
jgi:hypothetical protein